MTFSNAMAEFMGDLEVTICIFPLPLDRETSASFHFIFKEIEVHERHSICLVYILFNI